MSEFQLYFQPNTKFKVDSYEFCNYVYLFTNNYHITFYGCDIEILFQHINANKDMLAVDYESIEIFGTLPKCLDGWMVTSTNTIYGVITIRILIEYKSSSEISHGRQLYLVRMNTREFELSFHQLITKIELQPKYTEWKTNLKQDTGHDFEIMELYEQDEIIILQEEIAQNPHYGNGCIELTGLACPDFYSEPLM